MQASSLVELFTEQKKIIASNIKLGKENLPVTNTLAYFVVASIRKKKCLLECPLSTENLLPCLLVFLVSPGHTH